MADTDQSLYNLRYNQVTQGVEGFGGGTPQWTPLISSAGTPTPPAGSDMQVQFNNAGAFGASPALVWYSSEGFTNNLIVDGNISILDENTLNFYHTDTGSQLTTLFVDDNDQFNIAVAGDTTITVGNGWVQIPQGISDPPSPLEGAIWYNTTSHSWRGFNGTANGTFTFTVD